MVYQMAKMDNLVPPKEEFAHIMTIVNPPPTLEGWRKTHRKTVERLERKHGKPFRKILRRCDKDRESRFPRPPRSD